MLPSHCDEKDWQRHTVKPNANPSKSGLCCVLSTNPSSARNVFFVSWMIIVLTPVPGRFHWPQSFSLGFFSSCCLTHFSVVATQLFPFFPFNSFIDCLAESVPIRINQRRSPTFDLKVVCVDEGPLCPPPHQLSMLTHLLLP